MAKPDSERALNVNGTCDGPYLDFVKSQRMSAKSNGPRATKPPLVTCELLQQELRSIRIRQ